MAGDDEARARATLIEMQARISQGPRTALGLSEAATSYEQVRSAFLELTKRFHPARFGRMSTELQRLSNEVFLGIKSAHDTLIRASGVTPRGGGMPVISSEGSTKTSRPERSGAAPVQPRATHSPLQRPAGTQAPATTQTRPTTPTHQKSPPARTQTPPGGVPIVSRAPTPTTPTTRPTTPSGRTPPKPEEVSDAITLRFGNQSPAHKTTPVFEERAALQQALALIQARNWAGARQALNALATAVPSKQYRALLCYTRGREAQSTGRAEEAFLEYQRALQLDPDLEQVKQAVAELMQGRR